MVVVQLLYNIAKTRQRMKLNVHDYEDEVWRLITVGPSTCICCYVVAENHYPVSNLSINLGPVALLRIEGRLKGTGVKNRSLFEIARSAESYDGKS